MFTRGSYNSFAGVLDRLVPSKTQFRPQTAAARGLADARFLHEPHVAFTSAYSVPTIDFVSGRERRHNVMLVLISPVAKVSWARALVGDDGVRRPISSVVHSGVSMLNGQLGMDAVCAPPASGRLASASARAPLVRDIR